MAALQTLRSVGAGMAETQQQVSTGLRVQAASDNAAYWSISTTMRSDNKAISAVTDALNLGAAKIDTAYMALDATVDVVTEIRAKLVAAKEPGVDKAKIQKELDQLKQQLLSIASSASFNSVNWLDTDTPRNLWDLTSLPTSITSSFTRTADGAVQIGTTDVDIAEISLFNAGGGGILQKDPRALGNLGGIRDANVYQRGGSSDTFAFTGTFALSGSDSISFDIRVDDGPHAPGIDYSVSIDKALIDATLSTTDGMINNVSEFSRVLGAAFANAGVPVNTTYSWGNGYQHVIISSSEQTGLPGSSVEIGTVASTLPGDFAFGLENPPATNTDNHYPRWDFMFGGPFQVHRSVAFSFEIEVNSSARQKITIDKPFVDSVLNVTDGKVSSAADFAAILDAALSGKGLTVSSTGSLIRFDIDQSLFPEAGRRAIIQLQNIDDNIGRTQNFDILDVDITDPGNDLDNYLSGVDVMLEKAISATATLGAIKTRVTMQTDFAQALMDTIDKGVGRLVDADMNEASTRLKALQSQEQLAIQSLQIANSNAGNILQLFR